MHKPPGSAPNTSSARAGADPMELVFNFDDDFKPSSPLGPAAMSSNASDNDSMQVHGRTLTPTRKSLQAI